MLRRDELADQNADQRQADRDFHASEQAWQRIRQADFPEQLERRAAHGTPEIDDLGVGFVVVGFGRLDSAPCAEMAAHDIAEDLKSGRITTPLEIGDVWPENYSTNSVQKVWAAKYAARHVNLACLDLSSFKCGHDAPTYGLIDSIIASAGKAYSALHDIDANKPSGSIKIRVKTYAHTLMLLKEKLEDQATKVVELDRTMIEKKLEMMLALQRKLAGIGRTDDRLDREIKQLDERVTAWRAADESAKPKAKRPAALNVMRQ